MREIFFSKNEQRNVFSFLPQKSSKQRAKKIGFVLKGDNETDNTTPHARRRPPRRKTHSREHQQRLRGGGRGKRKCSAGVKTVREILFHSVSDTIRSHFHADRVFAGFSFVIKRESDANKTTERNKKRVEDYLVRVFDRASPERGTYSWRKNPRD
jgi:hypothetical protein